MKLRLLLAVLALTTAAARASVSIIGNTPQGPIYRAEVPIADFARVTQPDHQAEWSWVTAVSNIFRFYKHPISPEALVKTVYGDPASLPAFSAQALAQFLNRDWTDDNGKKFHSRLTGTFDAAGTANSLNNAVMIENLQNGRPLLVCNAHNCMVITSGNYTGTQVLALGVSDPWPAGPATRNLSPIELIPAPTGQLTFIGAVSVTDADAGAAGAAPAGDQSTQAALGDWTGALHLPQGQLHIVLHVTQPGGVLSATTDSPDQQSFGVPVDSIVVNGGTLTYGVSSLGVTYTGTINGNTITGTFSQHGINLPLVYTKP